MQCDKCHIHIEEDNTYERILCGRCQRDEELPPDTYCAHCGATIRWRKVLEGIKQVGYKLRFLRYPAWIFFFLVVCAFLWRNLLYTQVLIGIAVVIVGLLCAVIALFLAFPGLYFSGKWVGEKIWGRGEMPNFDDSPAGVITWLFGALVVGSPVLLWLLGLLFRMIGRHYIG